MKDRERIEKERWERFERLKKRSDHFQEHKQLKKKEEPEEKPEPEEKEYEPSFGIGSAVTAVLVVAIMVIIGALAYGFVRDAMVVDLPSLGSATNATFSTAGAAEGGLLSVGVIVLAAVAILGIVLMLKAVA